MRHPVAVVLALALIGCEASASSTKLVPGVASVKGVAVGMHIKNEEITGRFTCGEIQKPSEQVVALLGEAAKRIGGGSCTLKRSVNESIAKVSVHHWTLLVGPDERVHSMEIRFNATGHADVVAALRTRFGNEHRVFNRRGQGAVRDWLFKTGALRLFETHQNPWSAALLVLDDHPPPAEPSSAERAADL